MVELLGPTNYSPPEKIDTQTPITNQQIQDQTIPPQSNNQIAGPQKNDNQASIKPASPPWPSAGPAVCPRRPGRSWRLRLWEVGTMLKEIIAQVEEARIWREGMDLVNGSKDCRRND